ncbi:MAG: hypothetical protein V9G04_15515 [Nocardioides sp.]
MLVMITAIHERLSREEHDFVALWERLSSPDAEAITFLFLPIDDMESGDDLYIKMNSRGKPLTEFEVFKARFEKLLGASGRQAELSEKFDREWSDLLWHYEGGNFLVDDEFMNYLAFIVDVCEWRAGATRGQAPSSIVPAGFSWSTRTRTPTSGSCSSPSTPGWAKRLQTTCLPRSSRSSSPLEATLTLACCSSSRRTRTFSEHASRTTGPSSSP